MSINVDKSLCTWCVPCPQYSTDAFLHCGYQSGHSILIRAVRTEKVMLMQDDGSEATAFVYVWQAKYRNMLEEVPWNFENFMKNDFKAYWGEELEDGLAQ